MKRLVLLIVLSILLVGCSESKTTEEYLLEYEDFIMEVSAEIQMLGVMQPIWKKSASMDTKDIHMELFYESRGVLKEIGYNKETKALWKDLVKLNEQRLELVEQAFDEAVSNTLNVELFLERQESFGMTIKEVELEYLKLKKGVDK